MRWTPSSPAKLPLARRYRQKVRIPPAHLGRPAWVDDAHFNLGYHVRHTALASPGGDAELRTLVGRIMSQRLDRGKPLWEMWTVEGLEQGHWALVSKAHHCMVDGVSGTDLLAVLLDAEPEPPAPPPDEWRPEPEPSSLSLAVQAAADLVTNPYQQFQAFRGSAGSLGDVAGRFGDFVKGLTSVAGLVQPLPASSLNGPIGPHWRWDWAGATLAEVKTVRAALGGTVNDVVLAAITAGFRDLLLARDEIGDGTVVRTLVPVSVRRPEERGTYNNKVSAMFAELPVGLADPGGAARRGQRADGSAQGGQGGGGGRGADIAVRVRAGHAARRRHPPGQPGAAPQPANGDDQRAGAAATALCPRAAAAGVAAVRSHPGSAPDRRGHLLLQRDAPASGSPATTTPRPTSACWPAGSRTAWPSWSSWRRAGSPDRRATARGGSGERAEETAKRTVVLEALARRRLHVGAHRSRLRRVERVAGHDPLVRGARMERHHLGPAPRSAATSAARVTPRIPRIGRSSPNRTDRRPVDIGELTRTTSSRSPTSTSAFVGVWAPPST